MHPGHEVVYLVYRCVEGIVLCESVPCRRLATIADRTVQSVTTCELSRVSSPANLLETLCPSYDNTCPIPRDLHRVAIIVRVVVSLLVEEGEPAITGSQDRLSLVHPAVPDVRDICGLTVIYRRYCNVAHRYEMEDYASIDTTNGITKS